MASGISDREMRVRRRDQQREDEETKRNELLEIARMQKQIELIRKQRDQLQAQRQRENALEATNRDIDLEASYIPRDYVVAEERELDKTVHSDITFDELEIRSNASFSYEDEVFVDKDNIDESYQLNVEAERLYKELSNLTPIENSETKLKSRYNILQSGNDTKGKEAAGYKESYQRNRYSEDEIGENISINRNGSYMEKRSYHNEQNKLEGSDRELLQKSSFNTGRSKMYRKTAYKTRGDETSDGKQKLIKESAEGLLDERDVKREERRVQQTLEDRQRLLDEESLLKEKEYELVRLLQEQEDIHQKNLMKQRTQENDKRLERQMLKAEVEYYKKQLLEEQRKNETEMRHNQELLEKRLRREIEQQVRREIEQNITKQLEEKLRKELEERKRIEMVEQRKRREREEKGKVLILKRDKQRDEEIKLIERIEHLKCLERDIDIKRAENVVPEPETSDDEEDKITQERLANLKREMEALQERIKKKNKDVRIQKDTKLSTATPEKPIGKPRLPPFDGTQFEEWKLEVTSLIESGLYQDYVLAQAVRNSITSNARKVLQTLRPSASTKEIMKKMEDIYGNIRSGDSIIREFYSARQNETEPCSEWGVRIETLFNQALERGEIEESRKDKKLKERFWRGLRSEKIKLTTRSSYESSDSFDILRRKARIEEMETKLESSSSRLDTDKASQQVKTETEDMKVCQPLHKTDDTKAKMDQLLRKMEELEKEIREVKRNQQTENTDRRRDTYEYTPNHRPYYGGYRQRGYGRRYRDQRPSGDARNQRSDERKGEENSKSEQTAQEKDTKEEDKKHLN